MKCPKCGQQETTYLEPIIPAKDYSGMRLGSAWKTGADGLTYAVEYPTPCPHDGRIEEKRQ